MSWIQKLSIGAKKEVENRHLAILYEATFLKKINCPS